jgi:hypothetical protein
LAIWDNCTQEKFWHTFPGKGVMYFHHANPSYHEEGTGLVTFVPLTRTNLLASGWYFVVGTATKKIGFKKRLIFCAVAKY